MKCQYCDGKGEHINDANRMTTCEFCGGTGEITLTNEEWFCSLSTEEKVTALVNLWREIKIKMRGEIGSENKLWKGGYFREWLKEKHHD